MTKQLLVWRTRTGIRAFPALALPLLLMAGAAPSRAATAGAADSAQKRCFCLKPPEPGSGLPVFLMKMGLEECREMDPGFAEGRIIYDLGLLDCDDLNACLTPPEKEVAKREAALRKIAALIDELRKCCRGDRENCDKKCTTRMEPKLKKAREVSAGLESKALRRQDGCVAKKKTQSAQPAPPSAVPAEVPSEPEASPAPVRLDPVRR